MKLVIDIDEREYNIALKRKENFPRDLSRFESIIANGEPFSSAIDEIRAEIETKYESIPGVPWRFKEYDDGWVMALEWTLEIIDMYIGKESE